MFGTIRKHQTWLWAVIITLTIISFVIFFSPYSRMNRSGRGPGGLGTISGQPVTEQDYLSARSEARMHWFFMNGRWPEDDRKNSRFDEERETYQWLFIIQKQREFGIHVGDEIAADTGRQIIIPFVRSERARVASPVDFVQKVLEPRGCTMAEFESYVRHYIGLQEMINALGVPGRLITPADAQALYEREHQEVAADAVFFNASNYLANVNVTPEALTNFYNARTNSYAIPERAQVSYVKFNVTNFLADAQTELSTNLNEIVEEQYRRMGTNSFPDAKTPEENKAKLREQFIRRQALGDAARKATDFANTLFAMEPARPENLASLAATNGLTAGVTDPFDRDSTPKDIPVNADFTKAAFALTPEEPFSAPLLGLDGVYIIALNKRTPREVPSLEQIRNKVEADFKHVQAAFQARQAGLAFYNTLTNGLAQGKSFTNICAEAKVPVTTLPPFSLTTRELPQIEELVPLNELQQAAFTTPVGKVSTFQPTTEGGMLVYVNGKLPIDQAKMKADLPNFVMTLRRNRQLEAFDEWFRREASVALRDTPLARRQTPTMGGSRS